MRILWVGDPPMVPSAYGGQAALFLPRLRAAGHDVALFAMGGSAGATYEAPDGMTVYPTVADSRGNDVVALHAKDFGVDVVLTLGDPHILDPGVYGALPWLAWAPTDFVPPTRATLAALAAARWAWSPSRVGAEAYRAAGISGARWVPHGVDGRVFCPGDRAAARAAVAGVLGKLLGGDFLVAMVAANKGTPSRKGFYEALGAFKIFSDNCSGARLYLHTEMTGLAGGEDLREVLRLVGLDAARVLFPPQYEYLTGRLGPEYLADVYRAADAYLSTSHGEGFCLPLVEAQLCNCPVIVADNTGQAELCGAGGRKVSCAPYHPFDGATLWYRPDVAQVANALDLTSRTSWRREWYEKVRQSVAHYDVDRVFQEHFLPALGEVAREIGK